MTDICTAITNAGNPCKRKKYGNTLFCFAHQPENIKSKPLPVIKDYIDDEIFGRIYYPPPKERVKTKYSSFILTINTNRMLKKLKRQEKIEFLKLTQMIGKESNIRYLLLDYETRSNFDSGGNPLEDSSVNLKKIEVIGLSPGDISNLEMGRAQDRVHIHMAIILKHTGFYKLDIKTIKRMAEKELSFDVIVNVKAGGSDAKQIRDYVLKGKKYNAKK